MGEQKYAEDEPLIVGGYEGLLARAAKLPVKSTLLLPDAAALTPHDEPAGNGRSRPDAQVASVRTFGLQSYQEARDENDYDRDS
jgi:hypothetical protein